MCTKEGNWNGSAWGEEEGKTREEVDRLREDGLRGVQCDGGGSLGPDSLE